MSPFLPPRTQGAWLFFLPMLVASLLVVMALPSHYAQARGLGASTPRYGGTLRVAYHYEWLPLDPATGYDAFTWVGERAIFNALLNYAPGQGLAGAKLVPDLAVRMPTISTDGLHYTFTLRHGVMFQAPVNREVTAADVKYSIERALSAQTQGPMYQSPFWSALAGTDAFWNKKAPHISGIVVADRYTVRFDLSQPSLSFLNVLAMPFADVVPHEWVAKEGAKFGHNPVGTGAYTLQKWVPGQELVLQRNPHYFHAGLPYISTVVVQFGVNEHLQVLRVQKGQLDIAGDLVTSTDLAALKASPQTAQYLVSSPDIAVFYLAMNMQMAPFQGNLALRQAINMAIDRQRIARLLAGRAIPAGGIIPQTMPGHSANYTGYPYSVSQARALLAKAGYKPGQLHVQLTFIQNPDYEKVVASIQQDLQAIGIVLTTRELSSDTVYTLMGKPHTVPFVLATWGEDYPDPSDFFDPILSCAAAQATSGSTNVAFYCNSAVDALGNAARGNPNQTQRYHQYQQMERLVMADAPWVPLYNDVLWDARSPRVHGFYIHPVWPYIYEQYWLS